MVYIPGTGPQQRVYQSRAGMFGAVPVVDLQGQPIPVSRPVRSLSRSMPASRNSAADQADEHRQRAEDLLMGTGDPRMMAALDALEAQTREGPMSDEVQNMIAGRSADSAAAAAASQQQQLMEQMARSGGSMSDASFGAANRGIEANRMLGNNAARRDIAIQAAMQNFQGQQQAANSLAGIRAPANSQLADYYANAFVEDPNNQSSVSVRPTASPIPMPDYAQAPTPNPTPNAVPEPAMSRQDRVDAANQRGYDAYNARQQRAAETRGRYSMPNAPANAPGGIVVNGRPVTDPSAQPQLQAQSLNKNPFARNMEMY